MTTASAVVIVSNWQAMKFATLIDNSSNDNDTLRAEHGLSFWMQTDGKSFIIDTGASALFAENARMMGIDIAQADYLILSHAHADHTGGLSTFLTQNSKAKIYLSSKVCGRHCYSTRRGAKRNISIDHNLLHEHKERFVFIDKSISITKNVTLVCEFPATHPQPKANSTLLANDTADDFSHEVSIIVAASNGTATVISPCSHRGILNILDAAKNHKVTNFIGGLHLLESDEANSFESNEEIYNLAHEISQRDISLYTGHCTGTTAKNILKEVLRERFAEFHCGFNISL